MITSLGRWMTHESLWLFIDSPLVGYLVHNWSLIQEQQCYQNSSQCFWIYGGTNLFRILRVCPWANRLNMTQKPAQVGEWLDAPTTRHPLSSRYDIVHNLSLIQEHKGYHNSSQCFIYENTHLFILFILCPWANRLIWLITNSSSKKMTLSLATRHLLSSCRLSSS